LPQPIERGVECCHAMIAVKHAEDFAPVQPVGSALAERPQDFAGYGVFLSVWLVGPPFGRRRPKSIK
jgi:hypothetical protein